MPRYLKLSFLFLFLLFAAFTSQSHLVTPQQPAPVFAQSGSTCDALVSEALELVANNCVALGRNEVCYGHATVSATLTDDSYFFEVPGDIIPVTALEAIITRPVDPELGEWGIALMDIQADLPNAEDGMRMVLFGGVELEPTGDTIATDTPTCTFTNTSNTNFNMRTGPSQSFSIVDVLDRGESVEVYGITSSGRWVRSSRGWVFAEAGSLECNGADLLVMDSAEDAYIAPMQSFTLRMDEDALCQAAPSGMLIQTPTGETANLMVNNVQMRVGSTAFITVNKDQTCQTVANLDGHVDVTTQEVLLPKGAQLTLPLTDNASDCPGAGKVEPISGPILALAAALPAQLPEPIDIPEPWVPVPPTLELSAAEETIAFGECTTLTWTVTDALRAYFDNELAPFFNTIEVCPEQTTTYELRAEALTDDPDVTSTITIEVVLPGDLQIDFRAEPSALHPGECTTLYWNTGGATQVLFDMGFGNEAVGAVGNRTLCFDTAGIYAYALEVVAPTGEQVRRTVIVRVNPLPEVTFSATPDLIALSDCTTLTWTTRYAASVYLGSGAVAENGSRVVCPSAVGINSYTLNVVSESGQSFVYQTQVNVVIGEVILTLSASPTTLLVGECSTVSWAADYAQMAFLDTGSGESPVGISGSTQVCHNQVGTKTYTLRGVSFVGANFTTSTSVEVMAFNSFTATPNIVPVGGEIVLAWDVSNAVTVELNTGSGFSSVAPSGNQSVFPATTGLKTYTLRATSALGGTRTQTVTANVYNNPIINSFSASPIAVAIGNCTTVSWSVTDAQFVYINFGSGEVAVAASGSQSDCPGSAGTKTYNLRAVSYFGVDYFDSTAIEVLGISFTTSPTQVYVGNNTTVSWNVTGNVSATFLNFGGGENPVGNPGSAPRSEASAGTYTYTLRAVATNGGSVTRTTTLQVYSIPSLSISTSPTTIELGTCTTVSWSVGGATSVFINFGAGEVPVAASGSQADCPGSAGGKTYNLRAVSGLGDNYFANASVDVVGISFGVALDTMTELTNIIVSWNVSNAMTVELDTGSGYGSVGFSGSTTVPVTGSGTYTFRLRVTSNGGAVFVRQEQVVIQ